MNFSSYIQQKERGLTEEQLKKIMDSEEYIKKHKLDQLFNELLAQIIWKQPEDIKEALKKELEIVKSNRENAIYFTKKDFEILFENYDVQRQGSIKFKYVLMAFEAIGIKYSAESYKESYHKDVNSETLISKHHFLDLINSEYRKHIGAK